MRTGIRIFRVIILALFTFLVTGLLQITILSKNAFKYNFADCINETSIFKRRYGTASSNDGMGEAIYRKMYR